MKSVLLGCIELRWMRMVHRVAVCICFIPVSTVLPYELDAIPEISLNELGYSARRWTVDEGLPNNTIESITQTRDGYIWVGTRHGLARFNGTGFRVFENLEVEEIPGAEPGKYNWIMHLHGDEAGRLWVGIKSNILAVYEDGALVFLDKEHGFEGGDLLGFIPGEHGEMFLKTDGKTLLRDELIHYRWLGERFEEIKTQTPYPRINLKKEFWLLHSSQTLPGLDSNPDSERGFDPQTPNMLLRMRSGAMGVLTPKGIHTRLSGREDWTLSHPFLNDFDPKWIWSDISACESPDGYVWMEGVGSNLIVRLHDGGLRRVHLPNMTRPYFDLAGGNVYCDREGNVWACAADGLYQLTPSPFVSWQMDLEAPELSVYSVSQDGSGRMWFAARGGIYHLERGELRVHKADETTPSGDWLLAGAPGNGAVVLGRSGHLRHVLPQAVDRLSHLNGKLSFQISFSIATGRIWINSPSDIFSLKSGEFERLEADQHYEFDEARYGWNEGIAEDSQGRLYLTTRNIGLSVIPGPGQPPQPLTPAGNPEGKAVIGPQVDAQDRVWVNCLRPYGIGCWDGERWLFVSYLDLDIDIDEKAVTGLMPDLEGGLWLITHSSGVHRLDVPSLYACMRGGGDAVQWEHFTVQDGLASNACSFHHLGIFRDRDGLIWVAGHRGVSVVDPSNWDASLKRFPPPPVVIESYLLDDSLHHWENAGRMAKAPDGTPWIVVSPGVNRLEVRYMALHYARPSKVDYRYRLEGIDQNWIKAGNRREAYYQKLPPGRYRFHVMASNSHDEWNEEGAFASIVVLPAWWQTVWFRSGLAAGTLVLLGALKSFQLRRLRNERKRHEEFSRRLIEVQETERKRIAADLHDGLGQNLLVIKNGLTLESRKFKNDHRASQCLRQFAETVRESINEVRTISQNLRPHQIDRLGLTSAVNAMLDRLESTSGMKIERNIENVDALMPSSEAIHLFRIIQEASTNAVRHAEASRISVDLTSGNSGVRFRVEDDGKGFDAQAQSQGRHGKGFGLSSMEERSHLLGGTWSCRSEPGKGAIIQVNLPNR